MVNLLMEKFFLIHVHFIECLAKIEEDHHKCHIRLRYFALVHCFGKRILGSLVNTKEPYKMLNVIFIVSLFISKNVSTVFDMLQEL